MTKKRHSGLAQLKAMICILSLASFATPAAADRFVMLAISPDDTTMVAIDIDTIRAVGSWKRAWIMTSIVEGAPNGKPVYIQSLTEYDCLQERSQVLTKVVYDPVTKGVINRLAAEPWSYVSPKTVGAEGLAYACGKAAEDGEIIALSAADLFAAFKATTKAERAAVRRTK